jgi:hypothetical protein
MPFEDSFDLGDLFRIQNSHTPTLERRDKYTVLSIIHGEWNEESAE